MKRVLLVPSVAKGNGSGHLVRCLSLARKLGRLGIDAALYVGSGDDRAAWKGAEISLAYPDETRDVRLLAAVEGDWDLVILDRRASTRDELRAWRRVAPTLAVDEGGVGRDEASYLVDILPRPGRPGRDDPNKTEPGFLELPVRRREPPKRIERVLVTFGGEDRLALARAVARGLVARKLCKASNLTIVSGPLSAGGADEAPELAGATALASVQDLKEHLASFDLVITQFGLTALEAAWAGCAVALVSPTRYHRALAKAAGFLDAGLRRLSVPTLRRALEDPEALATRSSRAAPSRREDLAAFVAALPLPGKRACPACASTARRTLARFETKSYFRCSDCGMTYLERFADRSEAYAESYFFDEYRKQYGKTYLEDFPNLARLAKSRLGALRRVVGTPDGKTVLDVGCAYGAFLAEARKEGWKPFGIDVSREAVAHVRDVLAIPAVADAFPDTRALERLPKPVDCLTMWYVIEHFDDLEAVLAAADGLLAPGGIFAFSTPAGDGVSALRDRRAFLERSPDDHFTVWSRRATRAFLARRGYRVVLLRSTGHHPERFPFARADGRGLRGALASLCSRLFGLGDTFECYAIKEPR